MAFRAVLALTHRRSSLSDKSSYRATWASSSSFGPPSPKDCVSARMLGHGSLCENVSWNCANALNDRESVFRSFWLLVGHSRVDKSEAVLRLSE